MKAFNENSFTKASSITVLSILLISALVGLAVLAPSVRAADEPTLTLTPNSGSGALGNSFFGTITSATLVTVTGTGFQSAQDDIVVGYITLGKAVSASNFNPLTLIRPSLVSATTAAGDAYANANGAFTAQFYVPELQGGTYNIVAEYTPSSGAQTLTTATPFTVIAQITVLDYWTGASASIFGSEVYVAATGFYQSGESISFAPSTLFTTTEFGSVGFGSFNVGAGGATCTTDSDTTGGCVTYIPAPSAYVTNHKGGSVAISATGGTSSLTATTIFTLNPSIAFLNAAGVTTLSMPSSGGVMSIEGFNFPSSSTIPTNALSFTVQSSTTAAIMVSVTTDSYGDFPPTPFTVTQSISTGMVTVNFNGTVYSWNNGNIQPPSSMAATIISDDDASYAGPLLSSNPAGPAYLLTSASTYNANTEYNYPVIFGVNFPASSTILSGTYTPTAGTATMLSLDGGSETQANGYNGNGIGAFNIQVTFFSASAYGAFYAWPNIFALDASFATNNIISVQMHGQATPGTTAVNIASAAYFNTPQGLPWSDHERPNTMAISSGMTGLYPFQWLTVDAPYQLSVTGFREEVAGIYTLGHPDTDFTATLTSSSGVATTWATIPASTTSCANPTNPSVGDYQDQEATAPNNPNPSAGYGTMCVFLSTAPGTDGAQYTPGHYIFNLGPAPEVAGGTYTLTITGTSTGNVASIGVIVAPVVLGPALSVPAQTPGHTVAFETSTTVNTPASTLGVHGLAANTLYSIMLDGPSGVPLGTFTSTANGQVPPGTEFTMPSGAAGVHYVDFELSGTTSSALFGNEIPNGVGAAQYLGYTQAGTGLSTASTPVAAGLTIILAGTAALSPNVGGPTVMTTISGSGLTPNYAYYVLVTAPLQDESDVSYASFTATASGTIPPGTTFAIPNLQTSFDEGQGTAVTLCVSHTAVTTDCESTATFILQSTMTLSNSSAAAGSTLSVSAGGLIFNQPYVVVFNYGVNTQGTAYTGTVVGALLGGSDGTASGQFTVPAATSAGAYTVELVQSPCVAFPACVALTSPPTLTVTAPPTTGLTTKTFSPVGSATESVVSGQPTVSQGFTNTGSTTLSVYMWASVQNAAGQTVGVYLGSATVASGATTTIGAALFNLPSGTYTATVFLTTTSGIVVSTTSTTSSFSV